jgi:ElaB/YqjD/DUF883 family membrane-anchored ribosome-binding protein
MNSEIHAIRHDVEQLAEHAQALFVATADIASEKVVAALDQLGLILSRGRHATESFRDSVAEGACYCRDTIRKHPYETLAVGLALGALIGLFSVRRVVARDGRRH